VKGRVFLDTNILLYADDASAGAKRERARELTFKAMDSGQGVISTQVLQEYFVNATRKLKLTPSQARDRVEKFLGFEVITVQAEHVLAAIDLHRLRSLSFWDALVTTTASFAGCERLLTEDLQHGLELSGLRVENPFLDAS
jgi:predicted nucleic acid-binding protein